MTDGSLDERDGVDSLSTTRPGTQSSLGVEEPLKRAEAGVLGWIDRDITGPMANFQDPRQEWRRLFSELYGTFLLVVVAAGGGMMGEAFPNTISRTAAVVAPGLMVMGIIMFMGKVSGAHLNPAVSIAFSLRGDFPWRRVPGYIIVQLVGASLASDERGIGEDRRPNRRLRKGLEETDRPIQNALVAVVLELIDSTHRFDRLQDDPS